MTRTEDNPYPDEDFPYAFYFNGVRMPRWGANWGLVSRQLKFGVKAGEQDFDRALGPRDAYDIYCRIDHVGCAESAEPGRFVYTVQEVVCILLKRRKSVMKTLQKWVQTSQCGLTSADDSEEIYRGLLSSAMEMRRLAIEQNLAFWTSGYEEDCQHLVEMMQRSQLPVTDPRYYPPGHLISFANDLSSLLKDQDKELRRLGVKEDSALPNILSSYGQEFNQRLSFLQSE